MTARQWTERVTWSVASALGTSTRAGMMLGHRVRAHLAIVLRVAAVVGVEHVIALVFPRRSCASS